MLVQAYMKKDSSWESFAFYFSTENNQTKYLKYIEPGAPQEVNLHRTTRKNLVTLAKSQNWDGMTAGLKVAKEEVAATINRDILARFRHTPEYSRWWVVKNKKLTDKGLKAFNLLKRDLGFRQSEATLKALLLVVEGGRTPADRRAAFLKIKKMMRLTVNAAVHFRTAGLPMPA